MVSKTKARLIEEVGALRERIAELERFAEDASQARRDFGDTIGRYFQQVEHVNEAVYVIFDRKYEFVNDTFAGLFGRTPEEICSDSFDPLALVEPTERRRVREHYRQGTRGEFSSTTFEFTGIAADGSLIECETFVLFIPYLWGVAMHGMLCDVSVRKRIDRELQRQRVDLQIVLNSIPASVFYTDVDHRFVQVNRAFCELLGLPMERIVGKTITGLFPHVPAEQLSHFFDAGNEVMRSGRAKRGFIEVIPSLRGRRWIQNDRVPYRDEGGKICGVICLGLDISDFRETEEKLLYLSMHDVLTGLYNRTYFEEEMRRLENGRHFPISVITVRVVNLEEVNARAGIMAGNEMLQHTANVLKVFRTEDAVARIGGDLFAVILPHSDKAVGDTYLGRLREALAAHNRHHQDEPLQLSLGVSTGEKGQSLFDVLGRAKAAMR